MLLKCLLFRHKYRPTNTFEYGPNCYGNSLYSGGVKGKLIYKCKRCGKMVLENDL